MEYAAESTDTTTRVTMMILPAAALLLSLLAPGAAVDGTALHPFDGKTLDGWDGDRTFWSVQDGAIV